ncbi:TonB-dependent siderophore receptor [Chamaesiphon minutus]|uniref:TonB-dependent siderophore receptor n=1 Tax=Chamaesiphon minutus (strain ATCC 27169 / PCC 6605) TaxID=1173020 RepID=K9UHG9_CHAP6|nr:TonB-dependent siderophore receptor [Chamaesiphon minutus]AFY93659.1 TonB-dependent siderophore receptor [Chamaesiphon minutus PCC 6605]
MSNQKTMNLALSRQKIFTTGAFLPLCFVINILAIAISIPAHARSVIENNSDSGQPSVSAANRPATRKLLAQAATVKITGITVSTTAKGIEIRLESPTATIPQPASQNSNVTVSYDIPNATLALPNAIEYRAVNPDRGIAEISVVQVTPTSVRVSITGKEALPEITVATGTDSLVFSAVPTNVSAASEEIEIIVKGKRKVGYFIPNASSATGTNTPILETPFSVQIIPPELIRDRQATQVKETLANVSGVIFNGDGQSRGGEQLIIRGFSGGAIVRNGFRRGDIDGVTPPTTDIATAERIEVLKGPASILSGAIEPGGLINLITKKPLKDPFREVEILLGSRNSTRARFDLSDRLTPDGSILGRINGVFETGNSVRDLTTSNRKIVFAPTVTGKIGENTDLNVSLEYINGRRGADFGLPAVGNKVADVPINRIISEPDDTVTNTAIQIGYNLEHRFTPQLKLKNSFQYSSYQFDFGVVALPTFNDTLNAVVRFPANQTALLKDYTFQTNLISEFKTGSVSHTLLAGVDYIRRDSRTSNSLDPTPSILDLFNPTYGLVKPSQAALAPFTDNLVLSDSYGAYIQDQIGLTDSLKLLASLRYDTISQNNNDLLAATNTASTASALTPRVGLVYKIIPNVSLYGSYSQSFKPNTDLNAAGQVLEPQRGQGYEFGVKSELFDGKVLATLAYFDITKNNVAVPDPNSSFGSIASGQQRSQGIEVDISGEISPGWKLIATYANTNGRITADSDPALIGNKLYGVPENAASLWTTYEFLQGGLKGFGLGAGLNFVGERQGDLANSYTADSYVTLNAALFYKSEDWRFGLAFKNIGDVKYVETLGNRRGSANFYGDPFTIQATASWQF